MLSKYDCLNLEYEKLPPYIDAYPIKGDMVFFVDHQAEEVYYIMYYGHSRWERDIWWIYSYDWQAKLENKFKIIKKIFYVKHKPTLYELYRIVENVLG